MRGLLTIVVLLLGSSTGQKLAMPSTKLAAKSPAASLLPSRTGNLHEVEARIRFLQARIKNDPEDFVSYNSLASCYLQLLRETGDLQQYVLASRAATASLAIVPTVTNPGGLAALARTEIAGHDFAASRDHAFQLMSLSSGDEAYALLADSSLELGDYRVATNAVRNMERVDGYGSDATEIRYARLAFLNGKLPAARAHMWRAISFLWERSTPPIEAIAWCYWQLGETDFASGRYRLAEREYRKSLAAFPGYFRARGGLARARVAQGDVPDGIRQYKLAVSAFPDPTFVAALGDLYAILGRNRDAKAQYDLVEYIGRLSELNGVVYNRQLALFYADHDLSAEKAYAAALKEYSIRRDIYGADAVAWAALKAGKIEEARRAAQEALRLGTKDARLFYHAGLIARAAGEDQAATKWLQEAFRLNPEFDALQKKKLVEALAELQPD